MSGELPDLTNDNSNESPESQPRAVPVRYEGPPDAAERENSPVNKQKGERLRQVFSDILTPDSSFYATVGSSQFKFTLGETRIYVAETNSEEAREPGKSDVATKSFSTDYLTLLDPASRFPMGVSRAREAIRRMLTVKENTKTKENAEKMMRGDIIGIITRYEKMESNPDQFKFKTPEELGDRINTEVIAYISNVKQFISYKGDMQISYRGLTAYIRTEKFAGNSRVTSERTAGISFDPLFSKTCRDIYDRVTGGRKKGLPLENVKR